jgi:uroporphyrinogen III methyltransferase/synthase
MDARALHNLKIIAIGPATAKALTDRSLSPDFLPREYSTASIVSGLKDRSITGQRFLLPRADIADRELADGITHLGATAHEIPVYRNVAAKDSISKAVELLRARKIDVITFTSSSTVVNLASALGAHTRSLKKVTVACIGPKTADAARRAGLKVDIVATEYTMTGMVAAIEKYFAKEP